MVSNLCDVLQMRCSQVHEEVDQFIDSYISALEEHRRTLQVQVQEAHEAKLHMIHAQQLELERHAKDSQNAVSFAEDLLAESSDIEVVLILHFIYSTSKLSRQNLRLVTEECITYITNHLPDEHIGTSFSLRSHCHYHQCSQLYHVLNHLNTFCIPQFFSLISILKLFSHLHLGLLSSLFSNQHLV